MKTKEIKLNNQRTTECFWSTLKKDFLSYLNDRVYILFLAVSAIGSYGFLISHHSIGIDDLEYDRYYFGELISQGRLTATIFHRLFNLTDNFIWIQDFWGLVFLCIGLILLCIVFDKFIKTDNHILQIVFSCLFISYPLNSELFCFNGCFMAIGIGIIIVSLSLLLIIQFQKNKNFYSLIFATVLLIPAASWYESVLTVYIAAVFGILLLEQLEDKEYNIKFSDVIRNGILYAIPLLVACVIEIILSTSVRMIFDLPKSTNAANTIGWFSPRNSIKDELVYFLGKNLNHLTISLTNYFPIQIFFAFIAIAFAVIIYDTFKYHRLGIIICEIGLIISNFIISFFTLIPIVYRTCLSFGFFVAFIAFLMFYRCCKISTINLKRISAGVLLSIFSVLGFLQINTINYYFTTDDLRYQYEKNVLIDIGNELENNYDLNKPVVFVGKIEMPESINNRICKDSNNIIYKIYSHTPVMKNYITDLIPDPNQRLRVQTSICFSYINWSMIHYDQTPLIKLFKYCGIDGIKIGNKKQIEDAKNKDFKDMPQWPNDGYIDDSGEYIIINLGNSEYSNLE